VRDEICDGHVARQDERDRFARGRNSG
jgi:hypothetical protein